MRRLMSTCACGVGIILLSGAGGCQEVMNGVPLPPGNDGAPPPSGDGTIVVVLSPYGNGSAGASDLTELILESEEAEACFARNYLRFTFGREEDLDRDGCVLNAVFAAARDGNPLSDTLLQIALRDEFKTRWIEE